MNQSSRSLPCLEPLPRLIPRWLIPSVNPWHKVYHHPNPRSIQRLIPPFTGRWFIPRFIQLLIQLLTNHSQPYKSTLTNPKHPKVHPINHHPGTVSQDGLFRRRFGRLRRKVLCLARRVDRSQGVAGAVGPGGMVAPLW